MGKTYWPYPGKPSMHAVTRITNDPNRRFVTTVSYENFSPEQVAAVKKMAKTLGWEVEDLSAAIRQRRSEGARKAAKTRKEYAARGDYSEENEWVPRAKRT